MHRSTSLIENACVDLFTEHLQEHLQQSTVCLPTTILRLLQAMRATVTAIKMYIPSLAVSTIVRGFLLVLLQFDHFHNTDSVLFHSIHLLNE